ncbi:hypothetical protein BHE74_00035974 [Ensete ventricosum]|nr:hypothetical protein GW17_00049204 [Ensete ventricosum]RWW57255.1 hypothetical protein BHE74_00035974 [Ensete ventricosum]RZS15082.1 hypothetical protein BHM03_00046871 [Ensete ventricosum]
MRLLGHPQLTSPRSSSAFFPLSTVVTATEKEAGEFHQNEHEHVNKKEGIWHRELDPTSVLGAAKNPCDHRPVDRAIVHGKDMDLPVCSYSATSLRSPRRRHVNQRPHPRNSTEQEGRKNRMESRTKAQLTRTAYVQVPNDTVYKKERKKKNRRSIDQERIKSRKSPQGHQIPAPKNPRAPLPPESTPRPQIPPSTFTTNLPPLAPRAPPPVSRNLHRISSPRLPIIKHGIY